MGRASAQVTLAFASMLSVVLAGCDHGTALVIQNDMDERLIARVTGRDLNSGADPVPVYRAVEVAPHTRSVLVVLPFRGGPQYAGVDLLLDNCVPMVAFDTLSGGNVIRVSDRWRIEQKSEGVPDTVAA